MMRRSDSFPQSSSARLGLVVLLVLVAIVAYLASDRRFDAPRASEREPARVKAAPPTPQVARVEPPPRPATPVTPVYATRPEPSPTRPIYRCRVGSRTVYTQEPCEHGRVVVTSSAVDGYETKPSDRLERLVADGRAASSPPALRDRPGPSIAPSRPMSVECETLVQQVADLDAEALQPNSQRSLDRIRQIRQDVRASMARLRC